MIEANGMVGVIVSNLIVLKMKSNRSETNQQQQQQMNQKHHMHARNDIKCDYNINVWFMEFLYKGR